MGVQIVGGGGNELPVLDVERRGHSLVGHVIPLAGRHERDGGGEDCKDDEDDGWQEPLDPPGPEGGKVARTPGRVPDEV
jgi:hypothetical protein